MISSRRGSRPTCGRAHPELEGYSKRFEVSFSGSSTAYIRGVFQNNLAKWHFFVKTIGGQTYHVRVVKYSETGVVFKVHGTDDEFTLSFDEIAEIYVP